VGVLQLNNWGPGSGKRDHEVASAVGDEREKGWLTGKGGGTLAGKVCRRVEN